MFEYVAGLLQTFQTIGPVANPGAGRINPWPQNLPTFHHVTVGKYVGGGGLWVTRGGYAVSEVGIVHPGLAFVQSPVRPHVCVGIHEAWNDGFACHVHYLGTCGSFDGTRFTHRLDAVVFNQDISFFKYLGAFHGDDAGIAQQNDSSGYIAGYGHFYPSLAGFVVLVFFFLLVLFLFWLFALRFGLSFFLFLRFLFRFQLVFNQFGLGQVIGEISVANRPVYPFGIRCPVWKLATNGGQLTGRKLSTFGFGHRNVRHFTPGFRHSYHINFIVDLHQRLFTFGGHGDHFCFGWFGRWLGFTVHHQAMGMPQFSRVSGDATHFEVYFFVGTVPTNGDQTFGTAKQINALVGLHEVGIAPAIGIFNPGHLASIGADPAQVSGCSGKEGAVGIFKYLRRPIGEHNAFGFGIPGQVGINRSSPGQLGRRTASYIHLIDVPFLVFPGDVGNTVAIWRPYGHGFGEVGCSQPLGCPRWIIHHIQAIEYGKGQLFAIRRNFWIANLIGDHRFFVRNREVEFYRRPHANFGIHFKRNVRGIPAVDGQFPDFSTVRSNDKFAVGRKGHGRINPQWCNRFLLIPLNWIGQPGFFAGQ